MHEDDEAGAEAAPVPDAPTPASASPGMTGLRRWLAVGALLGLAVAAVSGIWLWFGYFPSSPVTPDVTLTTFDEDSRRMQGVHVLSSMVATVFGGLWVVLDLSHRLASPVLDRRAAHLAAAVGGAVALALGIGLAWLTGPQLAWNQIALDQVTIGTDVRGLRIGDPNVVLYLVDGTAIAADDLRDLALLHVAAAPVAVAATLVARRCARRSPIPDR